MCWAGLERQWFGLVEDELIVCIEVRQIVIDMSCSWSKVKARREEARVNVFFIFILFCVTGRAKAPTIYYSPADTGPYYTGLCVNVSAWLDSPGPHRLLVYSYYTRRYLSLSTCKKGSRVR